MSFRVSRVAGLLFCSGACALVYQVAWFRELRLIFGASTAASAAVLAVFMGGLGIGGARLGKRADTSPNPLELYANLEIAVAVTAAITPLLVWAVTAAYLASGGSSVLGLPVATALRLALSVLVLGPATFLMGGTLPAAARAVESDEDPERRRIAVLYGVNTMGAVLGTVLANFLLLEVLGTRLTLWLAALVNLLVGMAARTLSRTDAVAAKKVEDRLAASAAATTAEPSVAERFPWFPPAAAALAGAAFMLMELTWYRMLGPILGGSSYTFGLILAVALVGIGIGGGIYARTRTRATLRAFAATCSLEALFIVIPYALGDRVALTAGLLRSFCRVSFLSGVAVWALIAAFVVLPAAIVSGAQFPLVIGLYGRGATKVGRDVGAAYLANTLGAIGGSLAGGFGLLPLLGAVGCWRLIVMSLAIGAVIALALDLRGPHVSPEPAGRRRLALLRGLVPVTAALLLLRADGPSPVWRHSGIGAGRADTRIGLGDPNTLDTFTHAFRRAIRWEEDGVESSVALSQRDGFMFVVNGKSDGHSIIDAPTQVMSGLLPAMLHPEPKTSLVVGLGTGSTAGWLGKVQSMERVDVVELEPAILRVARDCGPVNEGVLDNPKVHTQLGDAREVLRTTPHRYDIIFSEPSNPYRAGISSMYTVEYYRAASQRLQPGGYFAQWMQAYETDGWAVATALTTLRQVFSEVSIWFTTPGDLLLLARHSHDPFDVDRIRARLREEPFASGARLVWRTASAEGVLAHVIAHPRLADILIEQRMGAVNTDDQNLLEFAFARSVGTRRRVDDDLVALAHRLGLDRVDVKGEIDRDAVVEERWFFQDVSGVASSPALAARPDLRLGQVIDLYRTGRFARALATWKSFQRQPRSLGEAAMIAECAAYEGGPDDIGLVEKTPSPMERDILKAKIAASRGDLAAAVEALAQAFTAARTDPWVRTKLLHFALETAAQIGEADARFARQLHDVLKEPFAVETLRDERLVVAARLAVATRDALLCVQALQPLEPPPFDERILQARAACYTKTGDPRAEEAQRALLAHKQRNTPFGASITAAPLEVGSPR